ncbi:MAG: hypothetical protein JXR78_09360 [Victivallales bacterium]|nr:hypothetical protein [Victivallales bacterium]
MSLHKNICALAAELDLEIDDFDVDYSESVGIRISDNKMYKMIIADESDECVWVIIETQKEKEILMKVVEKYFIFN